MQVGEGSGHERVAGTDRIHDCDRRSRDARRCQRRTRTGPVLAVRDDHDGDAGSMPVPHDLVFGTIRIQPGQIFRTQLQDVDQLHPALETVQIRLTIRDQTRADIGIQAHHPAPGFALQQPVECGSHRLEHERNRSQMEGRPGWQRHHVVRQQSTIGRSYRMEGVRRLAVTQVHSGQRRQIIGVDKVAGLHFGSDKVGAQHLPKGIAGQPGKECRRHAEAAQAHGNIEARSAGMRLVREVAANRGGRCQVDECVARHHHSRVGRHVEASA